MQPELVAAILISPLLAVFTPRRWRASAVAGLTAISGLTLAIVAMPPGGYAYALVVPAALALLAAVTFAVREPAAQAVGAGLAVLAAATGIAGAVVIVAAMAASSADDGLGQVGAVFVGVGLALMPVGIAVDALVAFGCCALNAIKNRVDERRDDQSQSIPAGSEH